MPGRSTRELLSAPAACEIDLAHALLERTGELAQDVVAERVAPAVVDLLEVVEIDHQERERLLEPVAAGELGVQRPLDERRLASP